mmetsp:Transcript_30279/g.48575  ORF Transcript_30279/g.48575 Transcript_30279/m.48575 type:complete len:230 (-) Transcript_30279:148-837(-)
MNAYHIGVLAQPPGVMLPFDLHRERHRLKRVYEKRHPGEIDHEWQPHNQNQAKHCEEADYHLDPCRVDIAFLSLERLSVLKVALHHVEVAVDVVQLEPVSKEERGACARPIQNSLRLEQEWNGTVNAEEDQASKRGDGEGSVLLRKGRVPCSDLVGRSEEVDGLHDVKDRVNTVRHIGVHQPWVGSERRCVEEGKQKHRRMHRYYAENLQPALPRTRVCEVKHTVDDDE